MEVRKVSLAEKFCEVREHWSPKIAGEVNDLYVKLVKFRGEFVWHRHENEDEMFRGDRFQICPRGRFTQVLLFEPKTTLNTGNVRNERPIEELDRI